jgi:hypothetical protein
MVGGMGEREDGARPVVIKTGDRGVHRCAIIHHALPRALTSEPPPDILGVLIPEDGIHNSRRGAVEAHRIRAAQ